jgi:predicted MFS family arabinose efflux permease
MSDGFLRPGHGLFSMTAISPGTANVGSPLRPFRHRAFAMMWIATVISNVGSWMQNAAGGWLMTTLDSDPFMVAMVQAATSLPMFVFALPAGALADIVSRRRLLLVMEVAWTVLASALALLIASGRVTPASLLALISVCAIATAMCAPAWQAVVPQLVTRDDLPQAVAMNSVAINISRAIGPALAGVVITAWGIAAPFGLNAASNLVVIAALVAWREPARPASALAVETFGAALRAGLRYARHNAYLRATLVRAVGFFLFGSAYWALLPLVARNQIAGGPALYGLLLGAIGTGAVAGAFALPRMKSMLGADGLVAAGTAGTAVAMILFGIAHSAWVAILASGLAGLSWIAVLATINVSAQIALPAWVRGRGLAVYAAVMFGAMSAASALWGKAAALVGLPIAHFAAAACALVTIPLLRRWKLQGSAEVDLTPSMDWPAPVLAQGVDDDRGPVLVTVDYHVAREHRDAFVTALTALAAQRKRDGAYAWGLFEDTADIEHYTETFLVDSWIEHLRQHQRVTRADRALQERIDELQATPSRVTHMIAVGAPPVDPDRRHSLQHLRGT